MALRLAAIHGICSLVLLLAYVGAPAQSTQARTLGQFPPTNLPPCGGNISFPPDIRLREPAPDLPPESAALVGVWEGSFAEGANPSAGVASTIAIGAAIRLAVEEVAPGRARIVLGEGGLAGSPGSWSAGVVPMAPGRLELSTNPVMVFILSADRQILSGTVDRASGRIGVRMTRCTMGETVVPRAASAPSAPAAAVPAAGAAAAAPPAPPPAPPPPPRPGTGRVLYQDDFTASASGWPRESSDPESRLFGYEGGEYYVLRLLNGVGWSGANRTREGFTDFLVEVDARLVAPTEGAFVFLGFRRQENGEHYALEVDPDDGTYRLLRHVVGGASTTVIGRTRSAAIQAGTATNRLGARAQGTDIVLFINGQDVGRVGDDRFRQGALALGVGRRSEGASTEGRFSNLVVTSIE